MVSVQADSMDLFSIVTRNLLNLGSCPLEKLAGPSDEKFQVDIRSFDLPFLSSSITSRFDLPPTSTVNTPFQKDLPSATDDQTSSSISMKHVAQLHETCQQTFGNAEALKFEFIEEDPDRKFPYLVENADACLSSLSDSRCHHVPFVIHMSTFARLSLTWLSGEQTSNAF